MIHQREANYLLSVSLSAVLTGPSHLNLSEAIRHFLSHTAGNGDLSHSSIFLLHIAVIMALLLLSTINS